MKFRTALCLVFASSPALAVPSIGSVTGTVGDDEIVTLSGSGFGENALEQEWLGGASGFIDSLADGARFDQQNRPGWSLLTPSTATYPHVSTELAWSRGKSVAFDVRGTTEYKQSLFYDTGSAGYAELYTNALIHLDHDELLPGSYLQWKMMRWTHTETVVDGDGGYMSNRLGSTAVFTTFAPSGQAAFWFESQFAAQNLPGKGAWYRYECWVRPNASYFRVRVTDPTTGAVVADNVRADMPYDTTTPHRFWALQNYFGNATDGGYNQADNGNAVAFWDDIYASKTEARVEICAESTYTACQNREVQPASAWTDGSIEVRLNQGALSTLSHAYLYVTDANGDVNEQGFELTGSSSGGTGGASSGGAGGSGGSTGGATASGGTTSTGGAPSTGGALNAPPGASSDDGGGSCTVAGARGRSTGAFGAIVLGLGLGFFARSARRREPRVA
jgi:hypothetical protein